MATPTNPNNCHTLSLYNEATGRLLQDLSLILNVSAEDMTKQNNEVIAESFYKAAEALEKLSITYYKNETPAYIKCFGSKSRPDRKDHFNICKPDSPLENYVVELMNPILRSAGITLKCNEDEYGRISITTDFMIWFGHRTHTGKEISQTAITLDGYVYHFKKRARKESQLDIYEIILLSGVAFNLLMMRM